MFKIVRTFHPVGQGAFYSEKHNNFNIVYDCGAQPLSEAVKTAVEAEFSQDDVIDILFISHLDYDHVSAISILKSSVRKIKQVVMPLIAPAQKALMVNINRSLSQHILTLISSPESFFDNDTKITYVEPAENSQIEQPEDSSPILVAEEVDFPTRISSGRKIQLSTNGWVFVPFNVEYAKRNSELVRRLTRSGFNPKKFQQDPEYTVNSLTDVTSRRALRGIYNKLEGSVNENSLILYSGPSSEIDFRLDRKGKSKFPKNCRYLYRRPGCIYTGDANLKCCPSLEIVFSEYKDYVGTIQIPHHGSRKSFELTKIWGCKRPIFYPVSYGSKNSYGHPAPEVINDLSRLLGFPLLINEHPNSIQRFYWI